MAFWKVYYSDGTTTSSENATPFNIKHRDDVQVIIQESDDHNWLTLSGYDYYMWDNRGGGEKWFGGDREGLSSYHRKPGYKCVLIGDFIDKKLFKKIYNQARSEFGNKESFASGERRP